MGEPQVACTQPGTDNGSFGFHGAPVPSSRCGVPSLSRSGTRRITAWFYRYTSFNRFLRLHFRCPHHQMSLSLKNRSLIMSPRRQQQPGDRETKAPVKGGSSKNRERHLEDTRHHPLVHPLPHPKHKTLKKAPLPPRHTPHSHPHGEELPDHTNPPSPIKPSKKVTRTGAKP